MAISTESAPDVEPEPTPTPARERRRFLSRVSIQSKLLMMLLVTSILSVAVVGFIGYQSGRSSLSASVFDRLTEVRESQARELESQVNDLKNSLVIYTRGETTTDAIRDYTAGFDELSNATIRPDQWQSVVDYYNRQQFRPLLDEAAGNEIDVNGLLPTSAAQRYLQAYYTAPFDDWDKALAFENANDGSAWSTANARYNDFFREIVTRFEFEDALLLDTRGNVVYSAYKGVDLGTNILNGPYRNGELADIYSKAMASNTVDFVGITDFGNYLPADEPTAWMISPVGRGNQVDGVLALQFPVSKINRLMTADKEWQNAGLGATGETFLAGPDNLMRSNSRQFIEDKDVYRSDVIEAGTPPDVADAAIAQGGTVLVQPVGTEATQAAQRGQSGTLTSLDYLGHETLQAYAPIDIPGLHWNIVAKIDTAEAFAPVSAFTRTLVLSTAGIIFAVCLASMFLSRLFVRPIRHLESGAQRISGGDYGIALPVQSRDEFGDLTVAFNEMSRNLAIKEDLLNEQREENTRLLLSVMPEAVATRYREGEETIASDHQDVSVIFADIVGIDELEMNLSADEGLSIVNRLVRQFDSAAEDLGIEQVRTLHNGYLASCGLNIPRLDNVRRTVDFAIEMQRIIDRFNGETGNDLKLRAGIDTGTVTSGLIGRSSLAYDMWGAAVNLAFQAQSGSAQPGIYVTSQVYDTVRDSRQFTAAGEVTVDGQTQPIWRLSERL